MTRTLEDSKRRKDRSRSTSYDRSFSRSRSRSRSRHYEDKGKARKYNRHSPSSSRRRSSSSNSDSSSYKHRQYSSRRHARKYRRSHSREKDKLDNYQTEKKFVPNEPNSTIIIRNLPTHLNEIEIQREIEVISPNIKQIRVVRNKDSGVSRGFAFVEYHDLSDAKRLYESAEKGYLLIDGYKALINFSAPKSGGESNYIDSSKYEWWCPQCCIKNYKSRPQCFKCLLRKEEADIQNNAGKAGIEEMSAIPNKVLLFRGLDPYSTTQDQLVRAIRSYSYAPLIEIQMGQDSAHNNESTNSEMFPLISATKTHSLGFCIIEMLTLKDACDFMRIITNSDTYATDEAIQQIIKSRDSTTFINGVLPIMGEDRQLIVSFAKGRTAKQALVSATVSTQRRRHAALQQSATTPSMKTAHHDNIGITPGLFMAHQQHAHSLYVAQSALVQTKQVISTGAKSTYYDQDDPNNRADTLTQPVKLFPLPSGLGTETLPYPIPDTTLYQYEPTSGYYYDPITRLYYDANTKYYYNGETQKYLYWDETRRNYLLVPSTASSATNTTQIASTPQNTATVSATYNQTLLNTHTAQVEQPPKSSFNPIPQTQSYTQQAVPQNSTNFNYSQNVEYGKASNTNSINPAVLIKEPTISKPSQYLKTHPVISTATISTIPSSTFNLTPNVIPSNATNTTAHTAKKEKEKREEAKRIAREMERWAKAQNEKKEITTCINASLNAQPPSQNFNLVEGSVLNLQSSTNLGGITANLVGNIVNPVTPSSNITSNKTRMRAAFPNSLTALGSAYNPEASSDSENEQVSTNAFNSIHPSSFLDENVKACLLCKRQFQSLEILKKHAQFSQLHKENLAKHLSLLGQQVNLVNFTAQNPQFSALTQGEIRSYDEKFQSHTLVQPNSHMSAQTCANNDNHFANIDKMAKTKSHYRDRAKERREKYGASGDAEGPAPISHELATMIKNQMAAAIKIKQIPTSALATTMKEQEKAISDDNIGNKMLKNMGWKAGTGLGKCAQGIVEPIKAVDTPRFAPNTITPILHPTLNLNNPNMVPTRQMQALNAPGTSGLSLQQIAMQGTSNDLFSSLPGTYQDKIKHLTRDRYEKG